MRYELRTTFTMANGDPLVPGEIRSRGPVAATAVRGTADSRPGWAGVAPPQWSGNRYVEPNIVLEVATRYRTVFGLTADRFRIEKRVGTTGRAGPGLSQAAGFVAASSTRCCGSTDTRSWRSRRTRPRSSVTRADGCSRESDLVGTRDGLAAAADRELGEDV